MMERLDAKWLKNGSCGEKQSQRQEACRVGNRGESCTKKDLLIWCVRGRSRLQNRLALTKATSE